MRVDRAHGEKPTNTVVVERTAPARDCESESGLSSDSSRPNSMNRNVRRSSRLAEKRPREGRTSGSESAYEPGMHATTKKKCAASQSAIEDDDAVASAKVAFKAALGEQRAAEEERAQIEEDERRKAKALKPCREQMLLVADMLQRLMQNPKGKKGANKRDLNEGVEILKKLAENPAMAEIDRIEADNVKLQKAVGDLNATLATQSKMIVDLQATVKSLKHNKTPSVEDYRFERFERRIAAFEARFEAMFKLTPAPFPRPTVASVVSGSAWPKIGHNQNKATKRAAVQPAPAASSQPDPAYALASSRSSRKRKRGNRKTPQLATTSLDAEWIVVGKRGKKSRPVLSVPSAVQTKKATRKAVAHLRLPSKAAVTLTVTPEAIERGTTYAQALREVQQRVDLSSLGIGGLRARRVATGAYLFEVPGPESEAKADSLVKKMREVFERSEDVRVTRPVKTAELRVSGLDPSVTPEDVAAAVAKIGGGSIEDLKVGEVRTEHSGLGAVWLRCPAVVADKAARAGRILVGWVSAGVRLLEPRPARCFRCLFKGHVRVKCTAECDRSGICYRCGQEGHKARQCTAEPHCVICASAGKPAGHRVGGKACVASSAPHRSRRDGRAEIVTQPQPFHQEAMEIAHK